MTRRRRELAPGVVWIDVDAADRPDLSDLTAAHGLDPLAVHDAVQESDLPKMDDFGDHLVVTFHSLATAGERLATGEIDAFVGDAFLITVHRGAVPGIDWLWDAMARRPRLARSSSGVALARLLEAVSRRYTPLAVELADRIEDLTDAALAAEPTVLADLSALRADELTMRRILTPQREMLDDLRRSPMLDDEGRRRIADVFDLTHRHRAPGQGAYARPPRRPGPDHGGPAPGAGRRRVRVDRRHRPAPLLISPTSHPDQPDEPPGPCDEGVSPKSRTARPGAATDRRRYRGPDPVPSARASRRRSIRTTPR